jgi:transposase InsO family protein
MIVALPQNHFLAKRQEALSLNALASLQFIIYTSDPWPVLADYFLEEFTKRDLPKVVEVKLYETGLIVIAAGRGLSIVPASARMAGSPGVSYRNLVEHVRRRSRSAIINARSQLNRRHCTQSSPGSSTRMDMFRTAWTNSRSDRSRTYGAANQPYGCSLARDRSTRIRNSRILNGSCLKRCRTGSVAYHKAEDAELLPAIRRLVDQRPTYGYRRIAALLNRERRAADKPVVNAKRVHRIMGNHAMLLEKHTAVRKGRIDDRKVMVMRSNLRWCSDGLEFACWNGEVIRLAFIIDAFDREIIAWTAVANAGISGSDVRDMMLEAVEKRVHATRAPHAIEHLSDNGSAYTARDTRLFAQALNLTPCFTPVASPQSNGMSEAFVKTLKRDYVRISALPDAETALRLIDGWIED